MRKSPSLILVCLLGIGTLLIPGCKSKDKGAFASFDPFKGSMPTQVEGYFDAVSQEASGVRTGVPRVYVDFSSGLNQAYLSTPSNKELVNAIAYGLLPDASIKWYKLANSRIDPLEFSPKDLFNKVTDVRSYGDIMAPIENAVKEITVGTNDALLITDFEEYSADGPNKGKEQFMNFAAAPFQDWLSRGNSITFFITDYKETGKSGTPVNKHLYFTVFNKGNIEATSLLTKIENTLKGRSIPVQRFDLSTRAFSLFNDYGAEKTGGIYYDNSKSDEKSRNVLSLDRDSYVNGLPKNKSFEFYRFNMSWKYLDAARESYQFKDFFRKLYLNLNNDDSYIIDNLAVQVSDVTEDFVHYTKCNEAANHAPKREKDSNGNWQFGKDDDAIAMECYDVKTGELLPDWRFHSNKSAIVPLKEVFGINSELFANNKKENKNRVELAVQFDRNYDGKSVANATEGERLIRVDIVLPAAEPNLGNPKMELFRWPSITQPGVSNAALYESIRAVLNSEQVKPKGQVIYSYFIMSTKG